jgi:hypothetical protein
MSSEQPRDLCRVGAQAGRRAVLQAAAVVEARAFQLGVVHEHGRIDFECVACRFVPADGHPVEALQDSWMFLHQREILLARQKQGSRATRRYRVCSRGPAEHELGFAYSFPRPERRKGDALSSMHCLDGDLTADDEVHPVALLPELHELLARLVDSRLETIYECAAHLGSERGDGGRAAAEVRDEVSTAMSGQLGCRLGMLGGEGD